MKLEELGQLYSYYSMTRYHRDFTKPSMDRLYAKILLEVSHHKFCPSATLRHLFPKIETTKDKIKSAAKDTIKTIVKKTLTEDNVSKIKSLLH